MTKQKTFLEPTWKREDKITIDGRDGVIKLCHPTKDMVQVEFQDGIEAGPVKKWYSRDELPPYPADDDEALLRDEPVPTEPIEKKTVYAKVEKVTDKTSKTDDTADNGVSPDDETMPVGNMDGETEPIDSDLVDVTNDTPEEKTEAEEEIEYAPGHKRQLKSGTTLTVLERSRKEHYLVRVHHAAGGTIDKEKHWKEIRDWGEPVTEPEKSPADEIIAAVQAKLAEKPETEADAPQPNINQPEPLQRESKVDHFVVRDRQGFHTQAASEWLNKHDSDGWRKEHIQYESMYIPAYGQNQSSYVETVMYVTFVRMTRVGA